MSALRLKDVELRSPVLLSPLAGFTDLAFRLCCREQGGVGLATTEMVSATAIVRSARTSTRLMTTSDGDAPLAVQIESGETETLVEAAKRIEGDGFAIVDINMGCPVRRIVCQGGGSAWTTTPERAAEAVARVVEAVKIPVTVKTRLGWDADALTAPDLARALEDVGVAALAIHGRTRAQGFSGHVDLVGIRAVVRAVRRMPVIGNGDVATPADAKRMIDETGCRGVSIGRAALGDPWIFRNTSHFLNHGRLPDPPCVRERLQLVRRHAEHLCRLFGERMGTVRFRKAGVRYSRALGLGKDYRRAVSFAADLQAIRTILDDVERGRYTRSDFDPEAAIVAHVPVPKGPVEHW